MHKSMEGSMILKSEGKTASDQMKSKKAEGPDQIIIKMLILGSLRQKHFVRKRVLNCNVITVLLNGNRNVVLPKDAEDTID